MKAGLVFLCVILAVIAAAKANDCDVGGHGLKVGESYSKPGECRLITCTGKGATSAKTCPSVNVPDPSKYKHYPQDNSKPYPECCPRFEKL